MNLNYTLRVENELFRHLSSVDDYNQDYSAILDIMNSENLFRSYGDGILHFLQMRNSEVTKETAVKYIEQLCEKNDVPLKDVGSINKLKDQFGKGVRPRKKEDSRYSLFALAFALELTPKETVDLFHKVYLDRAFDYRNEQDIICYYCLQHKKTWKDAKRLMESVCLDNVHPTDATIYTAQIKENLDSISNEAILLEYIDAHKHNLGKKNVSAKEVVAQLILGAKKIAREESEKTEYDGLFKNYNQDSAKFLYEMITGCFVTGKTGSQPIFKNVRLPEEIRRRFPEASSISGFDKDLTYEEIRKLIILLFSYKFWYDAQEKPNAWDISDYEAQLNEFLEESGFSPIYYGNPYDWLFLYCSLSELPLERFRGLLSEILSESDALEE